MVASQKPLLINLAAVAFGALVAWIIGPGVVKGSSLPQEWAFLALAVAGCVMTLRDPLWGLYLFPVALFIIPSTHLAGIRFLSPPLLVGGVTLATGFARRVIKGKRLHLSKVVLIVTLLLGWHLFYFLIGYSAGSGERLYAFAQGATTLFLAWVVIETREQATRVMYAWIFAWLGFSILMMIRSWRWAVFTMSLYGTVTRIPDEMIGGNVNVLAWIATLFVPVILGLAVAEQRRRFRIGWLAALAIVLLAISLTGSKAGLLGVLLSISMLFLLHRSQKEKALQSLIAAAISAVPVWLLLGNFPTLADRLQVTVGDILARVSWWQRGVSVFRTNPLMGAGPDDLSNPATHSYVVKSGMEFGALYVLLLATLFGLMLYNGWQLLRSRLDPTTRAICLGITVATLVAIPQAFFGLTFQASTYAMVFWVFQVVQLTYLNDIRSANLAR